MSPFTFELRRAGPQDAPALNALARLAYGAWVPVLGREPQPMATDWATLFDRMEIWALEGSDGLAASLALQPGNGHLTIWSVAVAPARRGEGLGARLLDLAEQRTRDLGGTEIRLFTNALMARNIALYTARGYRETRREVTPAWTAVHMAKAV